MPIRLILLLSLILPPLLTSFSVQAADIELQPGLEKLALDPLLEYLHDPEQVHQVDNILNTINSQQLNWQPGSHRSNSVLMESGLYWFKGTLINNSDKTIKLTLQVDYSSINVADLYILQSDGLVETAYSEAGLDSRFDNRPLRHRNLINQLSLAPHSEVTLLWRIINQPIFEFRATAWQPAAFNRWDQDVQIIYGMLYGILAVMALYNLFLFYATRQKSYLYYVCYVASAGYLIAAELGHIYQYLATDQVWAKQLFYAAAYVINIIAFAQFSIYFLNLKKHSRNLRRAIRIMALVTALASVAVLLGNHISTIYLGLISIILMYVTALWAAIVVRRLGIISAGHYIIAIMVLVFSFATTNMATLGLIPSSMLTDSLVAIGTTIMLVFFSLALADRINQLQKENSDASLGMSKANGEKLKARTELLTSQMERIKLEQAASQARMESRSKSDFLATMSHEIRQPMNNVMGFTEQLKSTSLDDKQNQYLNSIERSSQSLLAIINDLQDFAKIEAGEMELELASFNLETLLDDCVSTFSLRAAEKQLNFIADLKPGIDPVLRGDASKLKQIILNLLSNAFKFTDRGNITLSVSSTSKASINSIELKFEVTDSGIGLTQQERQRLFTPFHHADDTTYGRYGGSGLGLSISKQLAELMDGDIGVVSEAGQGSCFWFTARLLIDEHPDKSLLREKSSRLAQQRLLLVDPNPVSADIICRLLTNWGMKTVSCQTVAEAGGQLQQAQQKQQGFDIVLAEHYLGDGDSLELARQLQQPEFQNTSFVLMASSNKLKQPTNFNDLNIEILLEKPITNALLHDALIRAISLPQQSADNPASQQIDGTNLSVLLAEDNPVNQLVIQGLLKHFNIKVDLAANGLQVLQRAEQRRYDLILMDCEMPEMDGYEASHQIRAKEQQNDQPAVTIIALSAHARSDHKARAIASGMNGYLTKPVTLSELRGVIEKAINS